MRYILGIPAATVKTGMFYARKKLAELVGWGADYLNSVMRKRPPTAKADTRPRRVGHRHRDTPEQGQYSDNSYSGPSHFASQEVASPDAQRLCALLVCSHRCVPVASVCSMHFLGQKRPYDATGSIRPDFHDSHRSVR